MKKKKFVFDLNNMLNDTCKEVVMLQGKVKAGAAAIAATTYISANAEYALIVAAIAVIVDTFLSCMDYVDVEAESILKKA